MFPVIILLIASCINAAIYIYEKFYYESYFSEVVCVATLSIYFNLWLLLFLFIHFNYRFELKVKMYFNLTLAATGVFINGAFLNDLPQIFTSVIFIAFLNLWFVFMN
jgi:hypothetical protein